MIEGLGELLAPLFCENLEDSELNKLAKILEKRKFITKGIVNSCFFMLLHSSSSFV